MVSFARCFDRAKIDQFRSLIPKTYRVMEQMVGYEPSWPSRIECMTPEQIRAGRLEGAGHGLYDPEEQRIAINASMSQLAIYLNFIHENLHHALPDASEKQIDRLVPVVYERVTGTAVSASESEPMNANPMAPVTMVVRYNRYESWQRPETKPSALVWRRFSGSGMLEDIAEIKAPAAGRRGRPRAGRREPESLRQAVDWAIGKKPESEQTEGHLVTLTYRFKTIEAADKVRKRLLKIQRQGYSVWANVIAKRGAVERGRERRRRIVR